jgi:hypothetical protein
LDISSVFIDTHDATGKTVYVTVEGFSVVGEEVVSVYGSTDGGAHWAGLSANLPSVPVSGVVVDPQSASTVYLATDAGVYFTTQISSCMDQPSTCWTAFGTGLPTAPVEELIASPANASTKVLTAATYGRGVWQAPLCSASASGQTSASATPMQLAFGSQPVGTAGSPPLTVTVTNTGSTALKATSIAMSDAVDFTEADNCVGASLAAGSSCTVNVTFKPQVLGSLTGVMAIHANVCGGQLTVALGGTGTGAAGKVSLTPSSISFDPSPGQTSTLPPVEVGTTSGLFQAEAGNSGTTAIPISSVTVTPPFAIASNSCGTTSLAADTDCQMQLTFSPTQKGAATGTLTLVDGAGTQTVSLSGFGYAPPTDILSPTSLTFPATAVGGQPSAPQSVSLSNTGDLPLTCIVIWAGAASTAAASCIPIPSTGAFTATNDCNGRLAGPGSCSMSVVFAPTVLGVQTGTLWVYDALRTQQVALSGTGVQNAVLSVTPTILTFASQNLNVASAPQTLTITNSGGVAAANVGFGITPPASGFVGTNNCPAVLNPSSSCTMQVIFTPIDAGGSAATLTITSSTLGVQPVTVTLNGAGQVTSGLNVSPPQLNFAATIAGSTSAAQTVTISNTSNTQAGQLTLSVAPAPLFSLTQNSCPVNLAANSNCTVGVVFAPSATGPAIGTLSISSVTIANSATVGLSGIGSVAAAIQVVPPTVSFPIIGVGQTSSPATVTVTNTGSLTALTNVALEVPAGFQLVSNTCAATLGPGLSCTTGVVFAPIAAGAQTGVLAVTTTTLPTGASVPLQGTGFDFTVTALGSSTQSVTAGQVASYTLVLTPLSASPGAFTFGCTTPPADAVCAFSPATETLNSGVTGNVTVSVSTGGSTSASRFKGRGFWGVVPLVCGLFLLPAGWKRRHKGARLTAQLAILAILAGGVASCTISGGGGTHSESTPPGETPAGTYSIPINVTSTGVTHSFTVTLTVE